MLNCKIKEANSKRKLVFKLDKKEVFRFSNIIKTTIIVSALLLFSAIQAYAVTSGNQLWVRRYNGTGNGEDWASAIGIDSNNNVYVAGSSNGGSTGYDYAVIKYDSAGNKKWGRRYNGPANRYDRAYAIGIDSNNNVYVAGSSNGGSTDYDYAVIKYDSAGNKKWVRRYNGTGNGQDWATAIGIDSNNNVYVAGSSDGGSTDIDYAVIKYDSAGNRKWTRRYNGPANGYDGAQAIGIDSNNNVYVAGGSYGGSTNNKDYAVIKYDSAGNIKWTRRYNWPTNYISGYDYATAIGIDSNNNVYVAGCSYNGGSTNYDYAVIKYDSAGNKKWVRRYNGTANGQDYATAIGIDSNNNVYVAGYSYNGGSTNYDFAVIKYDSAGNKKWVRRYNGPANYISGYDYATAIGIDSNNNVYVAGYSNGGSTGDDFAVIKYDSAGNKKWVRRYNGTANGGDWAQAIGIDSNNNVYVAGGSEGGSTGDDFAVIKYAP